MVDRESKEWKENNIRLSWILSYAKEIMTNPDRCEQDIAEALDWYGCCCYSSNGGPILLYCTEATVNALHCSKIKPAPALPTKYAVVDWLYDGEMIVMQKGNWSEEPGRSDLHKPRACVVLTGLRYDEQDGPAIVQASQTSCLRADVLKLQNLLDDLLAVDPANRPEELVQRVTDYKKSRLA